jgi:hypothetical protein
LTCCDVYGNVGGDWIGCISAQAGTNGNFSEDPLFCDSDTDDFRLQWTSPCLPVYSGCGLVGCYGAGNCPSASVTTSSWAIIKSAYR